MDVSVDGDDEAAVIVRAQQGDRQAFFELRSRYGRLLAGFIRANVWEASDWDEVAHDAWELIWTKLPTYEPARASFATWARNWARFQVKRYGARQERRRGREVSFSSLGSDAQAGADDERGTVEEELYRRGRRTTEDVDAALAEVLATPPEVYAHLLDGALGAPLPPHHLIAFGFCKLLEWKPRQVVAVLADLPLREAAHRFEAGYVEQSGLPPVQVRRSFQRLQAKLDARFEQVVTDPNTARTYPHLRGTVVGETTLRDYFTDASETGAAADVSHWWHAAVRRLRSELGPRDPDDGLPVRPPAGSRSSARQP